MVILFDWSIFSPFTCFRIPCIDRKFFNSVFAFAKKLDLVDNNTLVLKTFNDYASDIDRQLIEVNITPDSKLVNKSIADADISEDILILMIKRRGKTIVPKGVTIIEDGDVLVVTGDNLEQISL